MDIPALILDLAAKKDRLTVNDVLEEIGHAYSRAYLLRFFKQLIAEGKLLKSGSTRAAFYVLPKNAAVLSKYFEKRYMNRQLQEHEVLLEVYQKLYFLTKLPEHIRSIFDYAFSEMLNNAIDHSQSKFILVRVESNKDTLCFKIDDFGVGVFNNIMKQRKLSSSLEAIQDLLKGKTTTAPHAHSGEGIFFTSKAADRFTLNSSSTSLTVDNLVPDIFIHELSPSKSGTRVIFELRLDHTKHLDELFRQYYTDSNDLAFDKTFIQIRLYTRGSIYVSRSQAKRVLFGLEAFRTVVLDFDKVPGIGQAFADEIFRVFRLKHPQIQISYINANEAVAFMIKRVAKI